jgi:tRNA uridine 5-carboxymethylaminomethyl modification enzyme
MHPQQMPCWITHTNERTHEIIRSGFDRSPMFTGKIEGVGPRYCPSVEDKINRFADKDSHQIFLEPEGLTTNEYYPNGISTSLPFDIQYELVRSMKGLENAHILRPGYAIEYDYFDPRSLKSSFETKQIHWACSLPGRSTAPRAMKRRRPRGCSPASTPRCSAGVKDVPGCPPRRGLSGRAGRRPDHQGRDRAVPHVHQPGRVPPAAARRQRRHAPDRTGRKLGLVDDARWDAFSRKRDAVSRETERLAAIWVNPRNLPAAEAERVLGKAHRARIQPGGLAAPTRCDLRRAHEPGRRQVRDLMFHVKHWVSLAEP